MKPYLIRLTYFLILAGFWSVFSACSRSDTVSQANGGSNINNNALQPQLNAMPKEPLSPAEQADLIFMREEEKLARDVYRTLYSTWGGNIFTNIASSEQTHMEPVLLLLRKYDLPYPVAVNAVSVFTNDSLQALFHQLVARGKTSLPDGYMVGATIEDLDIYDLQQAKLRADNQDIHLVYDMLAKGSRNHLRSFYRNIVKAGGNYAPQYITQQEFDAIINSPMETGY